MTGDPVGASMWSVAKDSASEPVVFYHEYLENSFNNYQVNQSILSLCYMQSSYTCTYTCTPLAGSPENELFLPGGGLELRDKIGHWIGHVHVMPSGGPRHGEMSNR